MTPLVGVTTYYVPAAWGPWNEPASVVPAGYFELVAAAGGRPVLLPPLRCAPAGADQGSTEVIDALDGLVLIGGGDIDPTSYGDTSLAATGGVDPARDRSELALLWAALERDLPVLAICRGLQLLNVAFGGTLTQHLPDTVGHSIHQPAPGNFGDVDVETVPGTLAAQLLGERTTVRCSHHQAVDRLGRGLVVSARSLAHHDQIIEAVEHPDHRFVLGVQWHPEAAEELRLFAALVAACAVPGW